MYRSDADFIWIPRYGLNDGTANLKYQPKYRATCGSTRASAGWGISGNDDLNILHGDKKLDWFTGKEDAPVVEPVDHPLYSITCAPGSSAGHTPACVPLSRNAAR